jgi:hypothetical protein
MDYERLLAPFGALCLVGVAVAGAQHFDFAQGAGRSPLIGPAWVNAVGIVLSYIGLVWAIKRRSSASDSFEEP